MVLLLPNPCTELWTDSVLFWYLAVLNLLAFFLYGYDKWMAASQSRRVAESALLGVALMGGSAGALTAMQLFRHKTRKVSFQLPLALILLLHAGLGFWLWTSAPTLADCRTTPLSITTPLRT